jgi:hypothetical protein
VSYPVTFPDRYIELAGLPLSTPAWELLNIEVLLAGMQARGSNIVIPHASGTRARRRRRDQRTVTLEMAVTGAYDPLGAVNVDAALGLLANLEALAAALNPPATTDSLVAVTLTWRGVTRNGFAQVEGYEVGTHASPSDVPLTIDLTFPRGGWEAP